MAGVKYHYALDECDRLVYIDAVDSNDRYAHKYHCLSCGAEMIPKMGNKRSWHFSHAATEEHCGTETYLHRLAKRIIREKFERGKEFTVGYYQDIVCADFQDCPFAQAEECHSVELRYFDLKKYYDTCLEEQSVSGYVADLLLKSSRYPKREPVLVEVYVTHKSTEKKCSAGLKIIEISIRSEGDIKKLISAPLEESSRLNPAGQDVVPVEFYGFKEKSNEPKSLEMRSIQRFYLFRSGKAYVTNMDEFKSCREVYKKDNSNAIFEVSIDSFYLDKPSPYDFGYVAARQRGIEIKTCQFCRYHKSGYEVGYGLSPIFCCMYKNYGTPANPEPQYAKECQYYREDKKAIEEIVSQMPVMVVAEQ